MYSVLAFFGPNLVIEEGGGWKRHRKVVASSFKETAFPLVWKRTRSSAFLLSPLYSAGHDV